MKTLVQTRTLEERLRALVTSWRLRAESFADHQCDTVAAVYCLLASEVEAEIRAWDTESLPIQIAAAESGYSAEHLRRVARGGRIPSERGPAPRVTCVYDASLSPLRLGELREAVPKPSQPTIQTRTPETSPNG